jgi:hypothetical protein
MSSTQRQIRWQKLNSFLLGERRRRKLEREKWKIEEKN